MNESVPKQDNQKEGPIITNPDSSEGGNSQKSTPTQSIPYNQNYQAFNYSQFPGQQDPSTGYYGFLDYSQQTLDNPDYGSYFYQPVTYYSEFPRAKDYNDDNSIIEAFPHLKGFNDPNFDLDAIESDDYFFIMRSSNDDNIHKAIKYHVWTSTPANNARLQEAWNDAHNPSKPKPNKIYLIYSVVNSYQFMGVAEMICPPKNDVAFNYWWEPRKWYGTFEIKWIFIKDVPHKKFEHIKEENQVVTTCKDCTRLSAKSGKQILGIFQSSPNKPNIFEAFEYMDNRENVLRANRDRDPSFSDKYRGEGYKGNFQQKRPWKPHGEYKRYNKPNYKKYAPRPYYSDSTDTTGSYSTETSFKDYQYQGGFSDPNAFSYNNKGEKTNQMSFSNQNYYYSGMGAFGGPKGYTGMTGGYAGGYKSGGYSDYHPISKPTTHHNLRTNSDEFFVGHPEIKEFSEQFVIKKTASKSPEKKKKQPPKKQEQDRVPDDFFDNKAATQKQPNTQEGSDGDKNKEAIN